MIYFGEVTYNCEVYPNVIFTALGEDSYVRRFLFGRHKDEYQYFDIKAIYQNHYLQIPSLNHHVESTETYFPNISMATLKDHVNMILSLGDVPRAYRDSMKAKILACAETMANVTHKNQKILAMDVIISSQTWTCDDDDSDDLDDFDGDNYDRAVEESLQNGGNALLPASRSSIEALERVEVDQQKGLCDCRVCLEDFKVSWIDCCLGYVISVPSSSASKF
ncbi:E3 ubiquitin-protein ligase synoviolin B-like [Senna tora]|uniref:E3 ubiquitin-protein ligase synoviolin B-like n=1 Tax=Senna tora TaxID=362788 RepID=A0A834WII5_9FABA|nr:E3 ubiquitin-protein ligase synoviolin B-like [Senna tora]